MEGWVAVQPGKDLSSKPWCPCQGPSLLCQKQLERECSNNDFSLKDSANKGCRRSGNAHLDLRILPPFDILGNWASLPESREGRDTRGAIPGLHPPGAKKRSRDFQVSVLPTSSS